MNTLLQYDLLRLEAFQNNPSVRNSILISHAEDLTLLKFKPVNYFNYCIGKIKDSEILEWVRQFYADTNSNQHQILIDSGDSLSKSILDKQADYSFFKKISLMKLESIDEFQDYNFEGFSLERVTERTIQEFAWLYLECFEAENRHAESVEENFFQKLQIQGIQFYFIRWHEQKIGITGLYQHANFQILSVGAVLANFRNRGFHKAALTWRIKTCRKEAYQVPIYSWAYQDSISHKNMIKAGMTLSQELLVYRNAE